MSLKNSLSSLKSLITGKPKPLTEEQIRKVKEYRERINREVDLVIAEAALDVVQKHGKKTLEKKKEQEHIADLTSRLERLKRGGKSRRQNNRRRNRTRRSKIRS